MRKLTKPVWLNYILFLEFSLSGLFLCDWLDSWIGKVLGTVLICTEYVPLPYALIPIAEYEKRKVKYNRDAVGFRTPP